MESPDTVLPTNDFDWIIQNGIVGLLLAAVFILGSFVFYLLKRQSTLEREYRQKQEELLREQVSLAKKTTTALVMNTEVLRRLGVSPPGDSDDDRPAAEAQGA